LLAQRKIFPIFLTHITYNLQKFYTLFLAAHTHVKEHRYFLGECNILKNNIDSQNLKQNNDKTNASRNAGVSAQRILELKLKFQT